MRRAAGVGGGEIRGSGVEGHIQPSLEWDNV